MEQGEGQLNILLNARPNGEVLADPEVSELQKNKIRQIGNYRDFFYRYFHHPPAGHYQKTTLLSQKAVSYLVVVTPVNQVVAENFNFPFVGSFPYLGFFAQNKAEKFQKQQVALGKAVWLRPVYAYSTLGYLNDPILSSFFEFNDFALADLIFHELMHTIIFINNEVDFNEALASYFSQQLMQEYFVDQKDDFQAYEKQSRNDQDLQGMIVELVPQLSLNYTTSKCSQAKACQQVLEDFLEKIFFPNMRLKCQQMAIKNCWPLARVWNNAAFAALMTYEKQVPQFALLQARMQLDLRAFLDFIRQKYLQYQKETPAMQFSQFLFT